MAPILLFTAEEAWAIFAGHDANSDETISRKRITNCRKSLTRRPAGEVHDIARGAATTSPKQLEEVRVAGGIGSSLQAEVDLKASGEKFALLNSLEDDLKFVLITSQASVSRSDRHGKESVVVTPSAQQKNRTLLALRADGGACLTCRFVRTLRFNLFEKGEYAGSRNRSHNRSRTLHSAWAGILFATYHS